MSTLGSTLEYIVNHVFLPPKLPQKDDYTIANEEYLCKIVHQSASKYFRSQNIAQDKVAMWKAIIDMLDNLMKCHAQEGLTAEGIEYALGEMKEGSVLAYLIREQNAGVIFRKLPNEVIYEAFEVRPSNEAVMSVPGKLSCSYPGPAISIPLEHFENPYFLHELSSFLVQMDSDTLDSVATTNKAGSEVVEERDSAHPRYITSLLTGILHGIGKPAQVSRISKRIADEVLWDDARTPWRRSMIWLVIRVAIQTYFARIDDNWVSAECKSFIIFLMCDILEHTCNAQRDMSNDLLFCMRAKIAIRVTKLDSSSAPKFLLNRAKEVSQAVENLLRMRWNDVQKAQAQSPPWDPKSLKTWAEADTRLTLPNSRRYIEKVLQRQSHTTIPIEFGPNCYPRHLRNLTWFETCTTKAMQDAFESEPFVALADIELSVQNNLDDWLSRHISEPMLPSALFDVVRGYLTEAKNRYLLPEDKYIMVVTLFDLWIALDKAVVRDIPLLAEFSPEVPTALFEHLLLQKTSNINRLINIHRYLDSRHSKSKYGSVFTEPSHAESFAVKFFNQSPELQKVKEDIEKSAQVKRDKKREEYAQKRKEHKEKTDRARQLSCTYVNTAHGPPQHSRKCERCKLFAQAGRLEIKVHEWPLPRHSATAQTTVFELKCPSSFRIWRDATYTLLTELCQPPTGGNAPANHPAPSTTLKKYQDLRPWSGETGRISLASVPKSFLQAHYNSKKIAKAHAEKDVIVDNGLSYNLYDETSSLWPTKNPFSRWNLDVSHICTIHLPNPSIYDSLQGAVTSTGYTPNTAIAHQHYCRDELSLHEFISFGTLRNGRNIQWFNIAKEVRSRVLTFHKEEVYLLLAQTAWQVGEISRGGEVERHRDLKDPKFCNVLLEELRKLLEDVKSNWMEVTTVRSIVILCGRVLAATKVNEVQEKAYELMRSAREVTCGWMRSLWSDPVDAADEKLLAERQKAILEMALACRSTYDVDKRHLKNLLSTPEDVSVFLECSVLKFDNTLAWDALPGPVRRLLLRDRRLSHFIEPVLVSIISQDQRGVDDAISAIWSAYRPNPGKLWKSLGGSNDRWIASSTMSDANSREQFVYLNLLDGKLLVDGKPLTRLPPKMTDHDTFKRIFGSRLLDIIPSDVPGFEFASRGEIFGHQVHFDMRDGELVIQAKNLEKASLFELIPHTLLFGDIPELMVKEYAHWIDLDKKEIEFRPLDSCWVTSPKNWLLKIQGRDMFLVLDGSKKLVDIQSRTFEMISRYLSRIEHGQFLTVTCAAQSVIDVELPRFRLSFTVNPQGDMESLTFPGMFVDDTEPIGTLHGLKNALTLKSILPNHPRRVLIPDGRIRFKMQGNHPDVFVDTRPAEWRSVKFFEYVIRTDLGYLEGDGSLTSHFYRTYLHALTSSCLPDPLTGRTGTEEALSILISARSFCFQSLRDDRFLILLYQIASLTPSRSFYPAHLQQMQTIRWSELPFLSQHPSFLPETEAILEYCDKLQKLRVDTRVEIGTPYSHLRSRKELWLRDYNQNSRLYASIDMESIGTVRTNYPYLSRALALEDEQTPCTVASWIFQPPSHPFTSIVDTFKKWKIIRRSDQNQITLSYSKDWLDSKSEVLPSNWLTLYDLCREPSVPKTQKVYQILFSLPSLAYSGSGYRDLLPILVQFATNADFAALHAPTWPSYNMTSGIQPIKKQIHALLSQAIRPIEECDQFTELLHEHDEDDWEYEERLESHYNDECQLCISEVTDSLLSQWPTDEPLFPHNVHRVGLLHERFMTDIEGLFSSCFWNGQLLIHIDQVQAVLQRVQLRPGVTPSSEIQISSLKPKSSRTNKAIRVGMDLLLRRPPPSLDVDRFSFANLGSLLRPIISDTVANTSNNLLPLVKHLVDDSHPIQQLLGKDLQRSTEALSHLQSSSQRNALKDNNKIQKSLISYQKRCKDELDKVLDHIRGTLLPRSDHEELSLLAGLWPRLTSYTLLRLLSYDQRDSLSAEWTKTLQLYAKVVAEFQRSQRLLYLLSSDDKDGLLKEVENTCPRGLEDVDWLLIQISNGFLARDIQVDVAQEMMDPSNSANSVLQLNMGEGKSSVIVPMIASSLADGHKLVRVVVLKALCTQMFQLLVDRVSGLANRRVFYMPFARHLRVDKKMIETVQSLYEECMRQGGILVVQPEHLLSFRLMGIDRIVDSGLSYLSQDADDTLCQQLVKSYRWLCAHSRDILDECDEILHVRYQLVYTLGRQGLLEDHPNRWTTIQEVFSLILRHSFTVRDEFPIGIHIQDEHVHKGDFPVITILETDARQRLFSLAVQDVMAGRLTNYPFQRFPSELKLAARAFICDQNIEKSQLALISHHCKGTSNWKGLLLLRGLIAYGVLAYALNERRWRVDYGLDERRTLLAVPYRAKDVPSLRAEFGHPDVAISLTCLSYYYQGLTEAQLKICFELLLKSDNPALEYERWARSVPQAPQTVNGVNLRDSFQRQGVLMPYFAHNHAVVNFFLSEVVFPKYAKRFPEKLSTCGWDLVEEKANVTTGFSGTKDSQYILPATISQVKDDLLGQESTNAQVIEYLLQPENNHYMCTKGANNEPLTASELIDNIVEEPGEIRVLLDVGAQILDMSNEAVAKYWLEQKKGVEAAVYFNSRDQMMVVDRRGRFERFISSRYRNQLDRCIVYLDDAHTRGTDLKLPLSYRAAVTLGPKVTKDRLTQGCMRLRKLGQGQSVMFFAPFKVDQKIRQISRMKSGDAITSSHVLRWAYAETAVDIEHHIPHWLKQGSDYLERNKAWDTFDRSERISDLAIWRQPDARTLEQMYGGRGETSEYFADGGLEDSDKFKERRRTLGCNVSQFVFKDSVDEEQEREVSHEVEKERQVQRPPRRDPAQHSLRTSVREFITTGVVRDTSAFITLFSALGLPPNTTHQGLLSTLEFATTIKNSNPALNDYMPPVTWIISGGFLPDRTPALVIISPFEADQLRSDIAKNQVGLYLHAYAPKVTQNQGSFEDLRILTVPTLPDSWTPPDSSMILQLNLFSGQLYLRDWETYKQLCDYLGLYIAKEDDSTPANCQSDGFIVPQHRTREIKRSCPFQTSPLPKLRELFGLRRKGNGYSLTHIGKILNGRSLDKSDFE
ncbi:hypothetical protein K435DRAFT_659994 [Dendrothele bispora CBS 962.96]|uniref:ubiquitinyl hydrolase 1 n=1 Tax=Dendrothele bispora (strain CBS 962.96) TaxID=1314807 RepID=A0A4S8MAA6_DENBC|nr:hypothetical protein K435DRAFT_659994 [Dendrothele bispora CBS 962.96]